MDCTHDLAVDYNDYNEYGTIYNTINETIYETMYNTMNGILLTSLISMSSIVITAWCMGTFFIKPLEEEEEEVKVLFEDKYSLKDMEYDLSRNNEVTKNTFVLENTPQGVVVMCYNKDREGFEYWADDKNVKFNYLETVARKFVIMNFCTNLYVDRYESIKKQVDAYDLLVETGAPKNAGGGSDGGAYGASDGAENDAAHEQTAEAIDDVFVKSRFVKKAKVVVRSKIVATDSNRYFYTGKVSEFKWLGEKKQEEDKEISFASFKNMSRIFG